MLAATSLLCCGLLIQGWVKHRIASNRPVVFHPPTILAGVQPAVLRNAPRRVYPFSIIRGGAYSKEELITALESDPVADSHYQVFQRAQLRTVRSPFVKPVYLSYRKDNRIYWTSHTIALHEGETLLTDGNLYARARCGNRISLVPMAPVAEVEPSPDTLDTPEEVVPIPETLLEEAVELTPPSTPVIGPEDFASPVSKPVVFDVPQVPTYNSNLFNVVPIVVATLGPGPAGPTINVPVEVPIGEIPTPIGFLPPPTFLTPVPEPVAFVPMLIAIGAFLLVSLRRRYVRPRD